MLMLSMLLSCALHEPPEATMTESPAGTPALTPEEAPLNQDATLGVKDPNLARLLHDHWEWSMRTSPEWATWLGDHRYDDRISDPSAAAHEAALQATRSFLARAQAIEGLEGEDALTRALLADELQQALDEEVCGFHTWNLLLYSNPVSGLNQLPDFHPMETAEDGARYLARLRATPATWDARVENLRAGLAAGRVANAETARRMVELVDGLLKIPLEEQPLMGPASAAREGWSADEREAFDAALNAVLQGEVLPALGRYREALYGEVLPVAREGEDVGLTGITEGEACYATQLYKHTTLTHSAEEIHAIGLAELERIHAEMLALSSELWGITELPALQEKLRGDPALHFATAEEILDKAQSSLARAQAAMPAVMGTLPAAACVVKPIPALSAPYTTVAYYSSPGEPGDPGEYFVNTYAPETRTRYEAEALAFHESVPGHHLQIALAQERPDAPAFRRNLSLNAYAEGWALYAERLADELGLYSGPTDRLGMLSYDAWRAARLVVDTGVHHHGWSRERAVAFMLANTLLAENNVDNEVDRYISWPGQALGYKLGQLELLEMRRRAEAELGEGFELAAFHDVILGAGPLPMKMLWARVEGWIAARG